MRAKLGTAGTLLWVGAMLTLGAGRTINASAGEIKLQTQLVWGTDDTKPPQGKDYKPVEPEIQHKLQELPLKWQHYFEVRRTNFSVTATVPKKVPLSDKCELNVLSQNNDTVEVALIGKGKEVVRRTQALPRGEILVLGGNAPNASAWLVILKRLD
jgi:hypothetical protein